MAVIMAVNIGNTNIRTAVGEKGDKRIDKEAILTARELNSAGDFKSFIEESFGVDIWESINGSIISTVVPEKTSFVTDAVIQETGKAPQRIDMHNSRKIYVKYEGLLGEDRMACCAGALQKYEPPFIVVDFGTATTVNVVNKDGEFIGGSILAGVRTSLLALSENTSQLPRIDIDARIPVIGKNTGENLLSGAVIGSAFAVEGYVRQVERDMGTNIPVIVTGGHASIVLPYCGFANMHEPSLLLMGLFALYDTVSNG